MSMHAGNGARITFIMASTRRMSLLTKFQNVVAVAECTDEGNDAIMPRRVVTSSNKCCAAKLEISSDCRAPQNVHCY